MPPVPSVPRVLPAPAPPAAAAARQAGRRGLLLGAAVLSACAFPAIGPVGAARPGLLADRQVLRLGLATDPETLDPARVAYVDEIGVVMRVHANLLRLDEKGVVVPDLAETLPTVSPDGKTLTFTLRSGLTYSDGRPVTARDFVFSWQRHLDPRTAGDYAFVGYAIAGGEALASSAERAAAALEPLRGALGVRAIDNRTLEFRLAAAAPWFASVLTTWCGVPLREDVAGQPRWTERATYVGAGPFVLVERERQNRLVFRANPRYHRGAPPLETIEISILGDPAVALAAYRNGEVDVVGVRREDLGTVTADPLLARQHEQFASACTTFLAFNATLAPFDRAPVRRAFSFALDREGYVAEVLGGAGVAASQLVPPRLAGHFTSLRGQRRDLAAARRQLSDTGSAEALAAVRLAYSGSARARTRVEAVAGQLRRALNVDVIADPVDARTFAQQTRSPATAPALFLYGWCQDYPDPQAWYSVLFHSRSALNVTGWSSAAVDRLLDAADAERDRRARFDLYQKAAQLIMDETPVAVLYHDVVSRLVKPHVFGLGQNPLDLFEGQANMMGLRILKH